MSYTLRGRLESRLAALRARRWPPRASLGASSSRWWPVELAGLMVGGRPARRPRLPPAFSLSAGLGGAAARRARARSADRTRHRARAARAARRRARALRGGWLGSQLLGHALLPLWRWAMQRTAASSGRAGAVSPPASACRSRLRAGCYAHDRPTVTSRQACTRGRSCIDRRETPRRRAGRSRPRRHRRARDDVTVRNVTVVGGENGISVERLRATSSSTTCPCSGAQLDGIHVRRAA